MILLPYSFYKSEDPIQISQDLLGKVLLSNVDGVITSGIIVETEAYIAPHDLASHAKHNRVTPKNKTMFADAGTAYVYKCYGIHDMINVVTAPEGIAHAILIRAIEPLAGLDVMQSRRKMLKNNYNLTGGPGKVAQALAITTSDDAVQYFDDKSPLQIFNYNNTIPKASIISTPRVGMSHFTKEWGHQPYRFYIKDNAWVSRPLNVVYDW